MAKDGTNRGRPYGVPNKQSLMLQTYVEEKGQGVSPGKVMLDRMWFHFSLAGQEMQNPNRNNKLIAEHLDRAGEAAKDVAPYVHTRLSSVIIAGDDDGGAIKHDITVRPGPAMITPEEMAKMSPADLMQRYRLIVGGHAEAEAAREDDPVKPAVSEATTGDL